MGTIAVGQRANLLLLDGDPQRALEAYEHMDAVILGGVPLAPEALASDGAMGPSRSYMTTEHPASTSRR